MGQNYSLKKQNQASDNALLKEFTETVESTENYLIENWGTTSGDYNSFKQICLQQFDSPKFQKVKKIILVNYAQKAGIETAGRKDELCNRIVVFSAAKIMLISNLYNLKDALKTGNVTMKNSFYRKINPMIKQLQDSIQYPIAAEQFNALQDKITELFQNEFVNDCFPKTKEGKNRCLVLQRDVLQGLEDIDAAKKRYEH